MAVGSYVGLAEAADGPAHDGSSPVRVTYLQYGIAFAVELPVGSAFCADPQLDCIFGTGGGIAGRLGLRLPGPWYLGAAYELSKHDSTKIYRLGILQQLRAEGRYYVFEGRDVAPFAGLGVGVSGYGNEWAVSTSGPIASASLGVEYQIAMGPTVGLVASYRVLGWDPWEAGEVRRGPGLAQMFGFELTLEARDPL